MAQPNPSYKRQLKEFELEIKNEIMKDGLKNNDSYESKDEVR